MIVIDKNQTLQQPVGSKLHRVVTDGAYICLQYRQEISRPGYTDAFAIIDIYLNDLGREVLRTSAWYGTLVPEVKPPVVRLKWWLGIRCWKIFFEEKICRKKS
jgi:hypothetical protein